MFKYIIIASLTILISGCGNNQKTTDQIPELQKEDIVELTEGQLKNSDIRTGKIEQGSIPLIIKVNGKTDVPPQNTISISVPMGGYLRSSKLLTGMKVKKGEIIAIIEDQQYIQLQQDYLTGKTRLNLLEAEYNRQKELNQSKASSDKVFQAAEADYLSQKIMVKSLAEKLKLTGINPESLNENNISKSINIVSPIDGFVTEVNMNPGKYAAPTDVLFELVDPTNMHLSLSVFEKDIPNISIGQKLYAYTNNDPAKKYKCIIHTIGKEVSPERAVEVHADIETSNKDLIPGMYMNAELEVTNNDAMMIPNDGLVQYEGKYYVFAAEGDKRYKMFEVKIANQDKMYTQITFPEGYDIKNKIFVLKGAYVLLMKMKNTRE